MLKSNRPDLLGDAIIDEEEQEYQNAIKNVNIPLLIHKINLLTKAAPVRTFDDGNIGINNLSTEHLARLLDENGISYEIEPSQMGIGLTVTHVQPKSKITQKPKKTTYTIRRKP